MSNDERGRSPELDQLRQKLFPQLPPEEGYAEIEEALSGQRDDERWRRIEELAGRTDLYGDLLATLHELREARVTSRDD